MKRLCVLIPSFNEAETIGTIVRGLRERDLFVYVVDDGSSDDTARLAQESGAVVIKNPRNMGKGAALRVGFGRALEDGYDAVLVMDGDAQHDVSDIAHLIRKMRETDAGVVIGNRMHDTLRMPALRIAVNRFMSFILSKLTGQDMPDSQCGFRLIRGEVLSAINLESSNYEVESEIIIKASRHGFKIESVPVATIYEDERSNINPVIDTIRFLWLLIRLGFDRKDPS